MNSQRAFAPWLQHLIDTLKIVEGQDFGECLSSTIGKQVGNDTVDYWLSMRAAKQIAMMEHNDRGTLARETLKQSDHRRITNSRSTKKGAVLAP